MAIRPVGTEWDDLTYGVRLRVKAHANNPKGEVIEDIECLGLASGAKAPGKSPATPKQPKRVSSRKTAKRRERPFPIVIRDKPKHTPMAIPIIMLLCFLIGILLFTMANSSNSRIPNISTWPRSTK